jgi:hypothetical protein
MLPEEDTINPKVEKCIDDIEKICGLIIDYKSLIYIITNSNVFKKLKEIIANKANSADAKKAAQLISDVQLIIKKK